jgi:cytosine/adenosine deaminase-related metal-dependent hydrolase
MARTTFTIHTSVLFDPKKKAFIRNVSIDVDPGKGTIAGFAQRSPEDPVVLEVGDIDLRGKVVMPGFVDSHTHIFLHSYE